MVSQLKSPNVFLAAVIFEIFPIGYLIGNGQTGRIECFDMSRRKYVAQIKVLRSDHYYMCRLCGLGTPLYGTKNQENNNHKTFHIV